jgi:hypothetical protein
MAGKKALGADLDELRATIEGLRTEITLLRASRGCHCGHTCVHPVWVPQPWYPSTTYPYSITISSGASQTVGATTTVPYVQNTAGGNYPSIGN